MRTPYVEPTPEREKEIRKEIEDLEAERRDLYRGCTFEPWCECDGCADPDGRKRKAAEIEDAIGELHREWTGCTGLSGCECGDPDARHQLKMRPGVRYRYVPAKKTDLRTEADYRRVKAESRRRWLDATNPGLN